MDTWSIYSKKTVDPRQLVNLETGLAQAPVEMVVELARTTITAGEVMGLAVGDVILTETGKEQALRIWIEEEPMLEGFPGAYKAHKAIRVQGRVRPKDTVEELLKSKSPNSALSSAAADGQRKPAEVPPKDKPGTSGAAAAAGPAKHQPKKPPAG